MSDNQLVSNLMHLLGVTSSEAKVIIQDARAQSVTDTDLDRERRAQFVKRLPTYRQAMRFA